MDVVARSGGEEFAVVLPEMDQHSAFLFAEELLDSVPQDFGQASIELTASAGVASFPAHVEDLAGLLATATRRCTPPRHSVGTARSSTAPR